MTLSCLINYSSKKFSMTFIISSRRLLPIPLILLRRSSRTVRSSVDFTPCCSNSSSPYFKINFVSSSRFIFLILLYVSLSIISFSAKIHTSLYHIGKEKLFFCFLLHICINQAHNQLRQAHSFGLSIFLVFLFLSFRQIQSELVTALFHILHSSVLCIFVIHSMLRSRCYL